MVVSFATSSVIDRLTIHCRDWIHRVCVGKAEEDVEKHNQCTSYAVDCETNVSHPEGTFGGVLSLAEEMWQDSQEIASRGENDERSYKTVERCR